MKKKQFDISPDTVLKTWHHGRRRDIVPHKIWFGDCTTYAKAVGTKCWFLDAIDVQEDEIRTFILEDIQILK